MSGLGDLAGKSEHPEIADPPAKTLVQIEAARREAKKSLWHKGILSWKFNDYPWQKPLYQFIRGNWGRSPHLDVMMHRRGGKSTVGLAVGLEENLRNPNTSTAVLCTTKEQAQAVCEESLVAILEDCPKGIAPRRIKNSFSWVFDHNGSKITILSADRLSAKAGRGRKFRFIHVMEAAFIPGLRRILRSVLLPTLRDVTGKTTGTMLLESTAPGPDDDVPEEDIEFWESTWTEALTDERAFFLPLSKNTQASPAFVEACIQDCGGKDTPEYRSNYELEIGARSNRTAIPEFSPERAFQGIDGKPPIVREVQRPPSADRYESLDPGGQHPTGELWGFYDFEKDLLVVEDEWLGDNVTSDVITQTTRGKESFLWGESTGKLYRIADNNNVILLRDLHQVHKLLFHATSKDDKDAQINKLRVWIRDGKIAIHPRCVTLIKTLRIARRHKIKRKGFEEQEGIGHADLLDALLYLVRNVRKHEIPAPVASVGPSAQKDWAHQTRPQQDNLAKKMSRAALGRSLRRW